jgi:hypothetical protein
MLTDTMAITVRLEAHAITSRTRPYISAFRRAGREPVAYPYSRHPHSSALEPMKEKWSILCYGNATRERVFPMDLCSKF